MKKSKFLFITLMVLLSLNVSNNVFATEQDNTTQTIEEKSDPEKDKVIQLINECLSEIEVKLDNIDKKIEKIRLQEEFMYYPAIRLNVDSPILGMNPVLENRLRVKKDISTSDVAEKYSIRDIVKNKKIRLPESYLGSIVVSTIEVSIDSNMELPQAKLTLIKCIQYLSQVNSASEFVDNQTNKIFKDYIAENKKNSIKDIRDRNAKIENELEEISDQIIIQTFLGKDTTTFREQYQTISNGAYEVAESVKNQLILEQDLLTLAKKSVDLEASVLDLKDSVLQAYEKSLLEMDYALFLENINKDYQSRINVIDKYIENSVTEEKDEDEKTQSNKENTTEEKSEDKIETTINYDVTSKATLEYMELTLTNIETLQEEYKNKLEDEKDTNNEQSENEKVELTQEEKDKIIEENKNKVNEIYSKYKELLSREYKFYTANINMLLDNSNAKISSVIAEIDSGIKIEDEIFNYTKYIYIDLPNNLTNYINKNNLDSMIELNNLINLLRNELGILSNNNVEITEMYNNMISEMLES